MVAISEEIKRVVQAASEINIVAINANLIAKRAGVSARGFGVVSSELRLFSLLLNDTMAEMAGRMARIVFGSANLLKMERESAFLAKASAKYMDGPMAILDRKLDVVRASLESDNLILGRQVMLSIRAAKTAEALVRSAKIEAVHGGGLEANLSQVATRIEASIALISDILGALRRWVEVGKA